MSNYILPSFEFMGLETWLAQPAHEVAAAHREHGDALARECCADTLAQYRAGTLWRGGKKTRKPRSAARAAARRGAK